MFGRYRFLRSPMGLCSSGDAYTHRFDVILTDIHNRVKIVDDNLMYDSTIADAFYHTYDFLQTCKQHKVTLNEQKFQFCMKEVNFAGFLPGWDSYSPAESVLQAISGFPMPEAPTITDIRAWFCLVNQLSPFFATSQLMEPFR